MNKSYFIDVLNNALEPIASLVLASTAVYFTYSNYRKKNKINFTINTLYSNTLYRKKTLDSQKRMFPGLAGFILNNKQDAPLIITDIFLYKKYSGKEYILVLKDCGIDPLVVEPQSVYKEEIPPFSYYYLKRDWSKKNKVNDHLIIPHFVDFDEMSEFYKEFGVGVITMDGKGYIQKGNDGDVKEISAKRFNSFGVIGWKRTYYNKQLTSLYTEFIMFLKEKPSINIQIYFDDEKITNEKGEEEYRVLRYFYCDEKRWEESQGIRIEGERKVEDLTMEDKIKIINEKGVLLFLYPYLRSIETGDLAVKMNLDEIEDIKNKTELRLVSNSNVGNKWLKVSLKERFEDQLEKRKNI